MAGKGKIKEAVKKIKQNSFKRQLARGEKKGTNVYMGRGLGTTTAKEAKKMRKFNEKVDKIRQNSAPQKATGSSASSARMQEMVNTLLIDQITPSDRLK